MNKASCLVLTLVASIPVLACSSAAPAGGAQGGDGNSNGSSTSTTTAPNEPSACGEKGRTGASDCPTGACTAGQYCYRPSGDAHRCVPGCTSDENCGASERCVKCAGEDVGSCRSCSEDASAACTQQAPACTRKSSGDTIFCGQQPGPTGPVTLPPKAFTCPDGADPPSGCEAGPTPGVYCCP